MNRFAIIGYPLHHSLSPQIHRAAFRFIQQDAEYLPIEVRPDDFERRLSGLKKEHWQGFNVTVPHKERILQFMDGLDETARAIGAVNTIQTTGSGIWKGFNTDAYGFIKPLRPLVHSPRKVLLIGAGGAARAVLYALIKQFPRATISIANRTVRKAQKLADDFAPLTSAGIDPMGLQQAETSGRKYDLIVNSTSLGMGASAGMKPLSLRGLVLGTSVVYDLIYNPPQTAFLREAQQMGLTIINGWPMLLHQAAKSFEIWNGQPFPQQLLRTLLKNPL